MVDREPATFGRPSLMTLKLRRVSLGILLATSATGATLGTGVDAGFAASTVTATVRTTSGALNLRSGPSSSTTPVGSLANGSRITISCAVSGQSVKGTVRTSSQWDRLTGGSYVSHAYVQTSESIVACAALTAATSGPTVKTNDGPVNVRSGPSSSTTRVGSLANGSRLSLSCYVNGETVRGTVRTSAQWDKLTGGGYISHAYVQTGASLPGCASTAPVTYKGTVKTDGGPLNVRNNPSASATLVGVLSNGAAVTMSCAASGDYISGQVRATSQWDRLTNGNYVSHAYVQTSATLPTCVGGSPVTAGSGPVGSQTNAQFIAASVAPAQQSYREYKVPPSVTIAQAILESGWGRSGLAANDRNYFGIKCFNGRYGTLANGCHVYKTNECSKAGTCFVTTASFRTYGSMANSFRDHGSFLRVNSRYKPAFAYPRNANKFIWNVWKAGYATDPKYYTKITGIMAANDLYQYDTWK
jgi:flagellar protein FlgJ